jgi:hypothetical protein
MYSQLFTNNSHLPQNKSKRVLSVVGCGGFGIATARSLHGRLAEHTAVAFRYVDTVKPDDISSKTFTQLRPDLLADDPDPALLSLIRAQHGVPLDSYRRWKIHTGHDGIARLQFLASLAALARIDDLKSGVEGDLRARSRAAGGVSEVQVVTISSLIGGTGAAAARVVGLASRMIEGLGAELRWVHVCVTSRVLPPEFRGRRAVALEHRQLMELSLLMRPGAAMTLPNRQTPISRPGPDFAVFLDSSAECPRTLAEATDELTATLRNFVTA